MAFTNRPEQGEQPPRQQFGSGSLAESMNLLASEIDDLEFVGDLLVKRLAPVLDPSATTPTPDAAPGGCAGAPLTIALATLAMRVRRARQEISSVVARIAIS